MKKGCLIAVAIVVVVVLAVAAVGAYRMNRSFGLTASDVISHAEVAPADTRLCVVIDVERAGAYLLQYVPMEQIEIPSWLPISADTGIPALLPREVALMGNLDFRESGIGLTLFINERRGGPVLVEAANNSNIFRDLNMINWAPERFVLQRRGVITAAGALPIPDGLEEEILQDWPADGGGEAIAIEGGHLLELALDNRHGAAVVIAGSVAEQLGEDWGQIAATPMIAAALNMLVSVHEARVHADLNGNDALDVGVRIDAVPEVGVQLEAVIGGLLLPQAKQTLSSDYGLTLEGDVNWRQEEKALIGAFTLSGFEGMVQQRIHDTVVQVRIPHQATAQAG